MWLAKRSSAQGGNSFEYSGDAPAKTVCAKSGEKFVVGACEYRSLPDCSIWLPRYTLLSSSSLTDCPLGRWYSRLT